MCNIHRRSRKWQSTRVESQFPFGRKYVPVESRVRVTILRGLETFRCSQPWDGQTSVPQRASLLAASVNGSQSRLGEPVRFRSFPGICTIICPETPHIVEPSTPTEQERILCVWSLSFVTELHFSVIGIVLITPPNKVLKNQSSLFRTPPRSDNHRLRTINFSSNRYDSAAVSLNETKKLILSANALCSA